VAAAVFRAANVVHTTTATERLAELLAVFGRRAGGTRNFVDIDPDDLPLEQQCGNDTVKLVWPDAFLSKDGRLFVSLEAFVIFINSSFLGENLSRHEVATELSRAGFERYQIQRRVHGKNQKRRYWAGTLSDTDDFLPRHPNELRAITATI
jgi:hypothetical protein